MAVAEPTNQMMDKTLPAPVGLPRPVMIFLIALVMPLKFKLGPLTLDGIRLILLLLIVPLTLNLVQGRYGRIRMVDIMFFLHALWMPVSMLKNNPSQAIEFSGSVLIEFWGGYMLARAFIRSRETLIAVLKFMIVIVILLLPLALYETKTGNPLWLNFLDKLPASKSFGNGAYDPRWGLNRTQVAFQHPIHFGVFCSMLFSFALVGLRGVLPLFHRLAVAGIIGVSVFCSLSSGPLLALLIQIFLLGWAILFHRVHMKWSILLGVCVITYILIDLLSTRTPVHVLMTYATFSAHNGYWRLLIFEYGIQNVWANPIFGLGLNDWARPGFMYTSSVDNFWLLHAMRFGIPGFLFLVIGYFGLLWQVGTRKFDEGGQMWLLRRSWMFAFMGITFSLCTVHVWGPIYSFLFFLIGAGVWMLDASDTDTPQEEMTGPKSRGILWTRPRTDPAGGGRNAPVYSRSETKISRKNPRKSGTVEISEHSKTQKPKISFSRFS